jgi:hypothetical protein
MSQASQQSIDPAALLVARIVRADGGLVMETVSPPGARLLLTGRSGIRQQGCSPGRARIMPPKRRPAPPKPAG